MNDSFCVVLFRHTVSIAFYDSLKRGPIRTQTFSLVMRKDCLRIAGTHSNTDILGQVSLLAVTKKKNIFFRFPFLEPERQQVTPFFMWSLERTSHIKGCPLKEQPLFEMEAPFIWPFVSMVVFSDF